MHFQFLYWSYIDFLDALEEVEQELFPTDKTDLEKLALTLQDIADSQFQFNWLEPDEEDELPDKVEKDYM